MAQQLPTQSQFGDYSAWPGRDVLDASGQRLGGVREIYLDRETGQPEWVLVDLSDSEARFVPLANAEVESWSIRVAHAAEKIHSAPGIGAEPRIDHSEERRLYAHYGLPDATDDRARDDAPPSWQARGGEPPAESSTTTPPAGETRSRVDESSSASPQADEPAAFSPFTGDTPAERDAGPSDADREPGDPAGGAAADPTPPWRRDEAEATIDAPPPADPPSPAELEAAQVPDEPPAASERATDYETAPFGAVTPPSSEDTTAEVSPSTGDDTPADDHASAVLTDDVPATTTPSADTAPGHYGAQHSPAAPGGDTPDSADDAPRAREVDVPPPASSSFAPPEQPASIIPEPPVTADVPEADDTPPGTPVETPKDPPSVTAQAPRWSSTPPQEPEHAGALERVKRSPAKIAVAGVAAAVLFFIVRKLR